MKLNFKAFALLLVAGGCVCQAIPAAANDKETAGAPVEKRTDYRFRQKQTPVQIAPYNTVVYSMSPVTVSTMRGDIVFSTKKELQTLKMNPSGVSFGLIERDKKGRQTGRIMSANKSEVEIAEFKVKKYGEPTAIVYTPDARKVLVSTAQGLFVFDSRSMEFIEKIEIPFVPTDMAMSGNSYYLALREGERVAVMNFEQKKVRRDWNYGVKVNDMTFNEESSEFAVLTSDGLLTIYDTRTFNIKNDLDNLGEGLACAFNIDGKYIAVATSPTSLEIVNLLRPKDRNTVPVESGALADLAFIKDADGNSVLTYTSEMALLAKRVNLEPNFNKLVASEVDRLMEEWQKMMPGESMEAYRLRVNDESRAKQRRLFEDEISTQLAGDLLAGQTMSLGSYDRTNQVLALDFSSMPTIYLPVPESDVSAFRNAGDLLLSDVQYGVLPDDTFEIVYAKVFNKADGKTYEYNNHDRVAMNYMQGDANVVSLEVLQQQQMEELKLQELREKIVEEAKQTNVISNHTNISVDSKIVPDYDADGNKILNYVVNFTYEVDPEFSAAEDFPPGKYFVGESGAASSMLKIVKEAFEGNFKQYLKPGKKLKVVISGTADATPIIRNIPYDGSYGDFVDEPIYENGDLTAITVTKAKGVDENRQLAFLRAEGVKDYLQKNVEQIKEMDTDYVFKVDVTEGKGSEFRRITANFTIVDAL